MSGANVPNAAPDLKRANGGDYPLIIESDILLFDGDCAFCSSAVRFLQKRLHDAEGLRFVGQESEEGIALMSQKSMGRGRSRTGARSRIGAANSIVLRRGGREFTLSAAAIRCLLYLRRPWRWAFPLLWLIPFPLRDLIYMIVARIRHRFTVRKMNNS